MAANTIECRNRIKGIANLTKGAELLREAEPYLESGMASLEAMKDGDGSDASHFALLQSLAGIQQNGYASANAAAKALYDEGNSVAGNAAAGIAAAKQLLAYLGV